MSESQSQFFVKYLNDVGTRLDENYVNPRYDEIGILLNKTKYGLVSIGDKLILNHITKGKTPRGILYVDEGIPFLRAGIIVDEKIDVDAAPKIDMAWHNNSQLQKSQLKKGNVLITMAGNIGECAVYNLDQECNCNQAVGILTINHDNVYANYLAKCLNSRLAQLQFGKLKKIADQPNVGFAEIMSIRIPLPSTVEEQEKIVNQVKAIEDELPGINHKIESEIESANNVLLDELELSIWNTQKRDFFFRNGKDERSPYFAIPFNDGGMDRLHYQYYDPELTLVQTLMDSFSTTTLDQIVIDRIVRGEQPEYIENQTETEWIDVIDVIKTVDLKDRFIGYSNCLKTSRDFYIKHPSAHVKKNDVLVSSTGYVSMGKIDVYDRDESLFPAMADGHVSILRLKEGYDPYFVTYFLRSHLGKQQFEKWWSGSSGQIEIKPAELSQFIITDNSKKGIPIDKQKTIAKKITEKLYRIKNLETQRSTIIQEAQNQFAKLIIED